MVAEREAGVRADAESGRQERTLPASAARGVFLLTGMPGSGKSTVGRQLAQRFDKGTHIDIDVVFHHFTVSGKAEPSSTSQEAESQSRLAVRNAASMAKNYADSGFVSVVEGAVVRRSEVELAARVVEPYPLHVVVLAPPFAVSNARDADRTGKNIAEHFQHLGPLMHAELAGLGLWLDTSEQDPATTVSTILKRVGIAWK